MEDLKKEEFNALYKIKKINNNQNPYWSKPMLRWYTVICDEKKGEKYLWKINVILCIYLHLY